MGSEFPYKIIDLTHTLNKKSPSWDLNCGFKHKIILDYKDCKTDSLFRVQGLNTPAGIGTPIDAPAHCIKGSFSVKDLKLEDLISPSVCIYFSSGTFTFSVSEKDI